MLCSGRLSRAAVFAAFLMVSAASSQAAVSVYTSLSAFTAATTAQGTDTFSSFSSFGPTASPLRRSTDVGVSYTYAATASFSTFYIAGSTEDQWFSTNEPAATILFGGFSPVVKGIGGNFFGSDADGQYALGDVVLVAMDSSGTVTRSIVSASQSSFLGFVTDSQLVSLSLSSVNSSSTGDLWPTANDLVLAAGLAPVPEVSTSMSLAAGLVFLGCCGRRRRARSADADRCHAMA